MQGVVAVSVVPIAVAFVAGVGGFIALLPLLIADQSRMREPVVERHLHAIVSEAAPAPAEPAPAPDAPVRLAPRASRLRLVATIGALLVWSVWSVRRPHHRGRHD